MSGWIGSLKHSHTRAPLCGANKESPEASEKVKEVNKRIERAREDVEELPGISVTQEERTTRLNALKKEEKTQSAFR